MVITTRKIAEQSLNVTIILACLFLVGTFLTQKDFSIGDLLSGGPEGRLKGQTLSPLPGYRWESNQETLVIFLRKGCHFCEDSMPFYRQLINLDQNKSLHAHLLAVMPDDKASGNQELQSGGLAIDSVFSEPLDRIQVKGTPTLLLIDAHGRVAQAWIGQLSPQRERNVIAAVER